MSLQAIIAIGEKLGLTGPDLSDFVQQQQAIERDERQKERDQRQRELEFQKALSEEKTKQEEDTHRHEIEQRKLELECEKIKVEIKTSSHRRASVADVSHASHCSGESDDDEPSHGGRSRLRFPKISPFD